MPTRRSLPPEPAGGAVEATAPVRVADVGGWSDTWFGAPGQVCHVAVGPGVRVRAELVRRRTGQARHRVEAPAVGESLAFDLLGEPGAASVAMPSRDPLLEQAVASVVEDAPLEPGVGIDLHIASSVPAGASLGTSASVLVAVVGALDRLVAGGTRPREALARLAHRCETERVGREAGVQDQWAAAFGGCAHLSIGPYPEVRHRPVPVADETSAALSDRLVTVVFGPHDSSAVHGEVIDALVGCGGAAHDQARAALRRLSTLAGDAASALAAGDVETWGAVLVEATAAQRRLHSRLVGPAHERAIDIARARGAAGWKVNGAGGGGGSLTVLAGADGAEPGELASLLGAQDEAWTVVDLSPSPGLEVIDA